MRDHAKELQDAADFIEAHPGGYDIHTSLLREAADEIERLRAASQWKPIETAPKDGTEFIAYRDDAGPFLLRWSCASEMMTDHEIEQSMMTEEEVHEPDWFFADFATGGRLNDGFTHWQPLPSPPTQEGGE